MIKKLALAVILFLISSQLYAFDGNRKGFVLGGSGGVMAADFGYVGDTELHGGLATKYHIGYGFSNKNIFHLGTHQRFIYFEKGYHLRNSPLICWNHFFNAHGNSFFTTIGIGSINLIALDFDDRKELILGGGYEFYEHLMFELLCRVDIELHNFKDISLLFTYYAY